MFSPAAHARLRVALGLIGLLVPVFAKRWFAGGLVVLLVVHVGVVLGLLDRWDRLVLLRLRRTDDPHRLIGPGWLAETARDITSLGSVACLTLICLAVVGGMWLGRRRYDAFVFGLSVSGAAAANFAWKLAVSRPRPDLVPALTVAQGSSFPSGHAMLSAVVYLGLALRFVPQPRPGSLRVFLVFWALAVSSLVALSRVLLGVHYPTDVLAGWIAGILWAWGADRLADSHCLHGEPAWKQPNGDL